VSRWKASSSDLRADADQPAQQCHLAHDVGVAPRVRDDGHGLRQREDRGPTADLRERPALIEPIADRHLIDRFGLLVQVEHGREDLAVPAAVEILGLEHLGGLGHARLREQHRPQHGLLGVKVLRREPPGDILPFGHAHCSSPLHRGSLTARSRVDARAA